MPLAREGESLRRQAFGLSERAAWPEVYALLNRDEAAVRRKPELVTLYGESLLRTGRAREARAWLEGTLEWVRRSGDRAETRRAWNLLGAARFELGELDEAEAAFETALELARQDGDDLLVARATNNLGAIANIRGRREVALGLYQLAIPAYQRLGHPAGLAMSYHNMAISYRDAGALEQAEECEWHAIEFAHDARDERVMALAQLGRAELNLRRGDAAMAEASARHVATTFERLTDPVRQSDALRVAGVSASALGKVEEARAALDEAIALARANGGALNEAEALRARAELRLPLDGLPAARQDAAAAAAIFDRLNARAEVEAIEEWLGRLEPPGD